MQFGNFRTGLDSQLRIQVGERFVEEEDLRGTDDSTAKGNTLALTTGKFAGAALEQTFEAQRFGSGFHLAVDFFFRGLAELQTKGHVIIHGHMRVQSVGLEYHGNVTIFRSDIVHNTVADADFAFGNFFQTSQAAQSGGFTAAGRAD